MDFYAQTYADAKALVDNAFTILDGFRGPAGSFTFQANFASDEPDDYSPPEHAEELGIQAAGMEFNCHANERT